MRRWPAEWERQREVLLCFPRRKGDWGPVLSAACRDLLTAARAIQRACPVRLLVPDRQLFARYATDFSGTVTHLPADDSWIRDAGPITVYDDGHPKLLDFTFNGWGGKFSAKQDNRIPALLRDCYPTYGYERVNAVLEGGAIESDGSGTVMTTSRCLLSVGRNDYTNKEEAEQLLHEHLGTREVLWLDHGELEGDDTDAHIDTVARFLDASTITYVGPPPRGDAQYADFTAMREQLRAFPDRYTLLELPWAGPVTSAVDGHTLPASYANFLILNGHLFLPTYGTTADREAISRLRRYGKYTVVPVDCRHFVEQHGALHCLTMQVPTAEQPSIP